MGPDSSLDPNLDGGFLDLLPLEVKDAANDLKLDQVEVASVWSVWNFWRSGLRAMTSSPSDTPTDHAADQFKAVGMWVGAVHPAHVNMRMKSYHIRLIKTKKQNPKYTRWCRLLLAFGAGV